MNKICTSLEQSKKLLVLGVDVDTADMCYIKDKPNIGFLYKEYKEFGDTILQDYYPAWSLVALLGLMPIVNESTYKMCGTLDGGAIVSHDELTCVMYQEDNPLDAAFEMICWLKENGKI